VKQKKTKLPLSTQTIRSLQLADQLKQVGGGLYTIIVSKCADTGGNTCPG
jgi:hypothetical protein